MRRLLATLACAMLALPFLAGTASAGTAGSGTQRWSASYLAGAPAFSTAVTLSPDGSTVFVTGVTDASGSGRIATLAYDAVTGADRWVATFPGSAGGEPGYGWALGVSPDGSRLFVTGQSQCTSGCDASPNTFTTLAYDAATGQRLWVAHHASGSSGARALAVSPDGSRVFVQGFDLAGAGRVTLAYDPTTGHQLWMVRGDSGYASLGGALTVSPDSATVYVAGTAAAPPLAGCFDGAGYVTTAYDAATGSPRWSSTYQVEPSSDSYPMCGTATDEGLSPDGSTLYVTGFGGASGGQRRFRAGTVAYDVSDGHQLWATQDDTVQVLNGSQTHLAVSPDGSKVFVAGDGCVDYPSCPFTARAYDTSDGHRIWVSRYDAGGRGYVNDLVVSPDGSSVYLTGQWRLPCLGACTTVENDAPLVSYAADTGDERWSTTYPFNVGEALAVSPDGASIYLAGTFTGSASTSARRSRCSSSACGYSTARFNTGPGPGAVQDPATDVTYDGWRGFFHKDAVGGAYRASRVGGSTVTFRTPAATSVTWLTRQGPDQGRARVVIDGRSQGRVDLYRPAAAKAAVAFTGLAHHAHTVTVRVLGTKAPASSGTWVSVDGFEVRAGHLVTEESSPRLRYDSWAGGSRASANGGTYRRSGHPGASVSLDFTGRGITWVTATGPAFGRARVVIDGKAHTVDLYRATTRWRVGISFAGLSRGHHRLTVRSLARHDPASRSSDVVVDAFVVRR